MAAQNAACAITTDRNVLYVLFVVNSTGLFAKLNMSLVDLVQRRSVVARLVHRHFHCNECGVPLHEFSRQC